MTDLDQELTERLGRIREENLFRELRRLTSAQSPEIDLDGRPTLNFSSNDYLGLANDPVLKEAARRAIDQFGVGSGASRLICGSLAPHDLLEQTLAEFKGLEAVLTFSSGFAAALGTIGALVGRDDVIIIDKLAHACIVDAARSCGAKLRVFAHNDLNQLEEILKWADQRQARLAAGPADPPSDELSPVSIRSRRGQILVVTESLFSMDGDHAPLPELVALKDQYGAWLMVDEAHATGLYGAKRTGLAEEWGVTQRIDIHLGTLGKALGSAGGYVGGSRRLIEYLIHRARSFVFSTAPIPAAVAAAEAAVRFVRSDAGADRRTLLWERVREVAKGLSCIGRESRERGSRNEGDRSATMEAPAWTAAEGLADPWNRGGDRPPGRGVADWGSAIIPLMVGEESRALEMAARLHAQGILLPAIRYPTVARGRARLRLTITAAHTSPQIARLMEALTPYPFST